MVRNILVSWGKLEGGGAINIVFNLIEMAIVGFKEGGSEIPIDVVSVEIGFEI